MSGPLGVLVVVAYVAGTLELMNHASFDTWGGVIVGPIVIALCVPVVMRFARQQAGSRLGPIIIYGFWFKVLCTIASYLTTIILYHGVGDSYEYSKQANNLIEAWHHTGLAWPDRGIPGSGFIDLLTALIYQITGRTLLGGNFVFAMLGFWGVCAFFKAVQVALPDVDIHRYAKLIFFLPSLAFWPSSVGKDSWMLWSLGIGTLGAAKIYQHRHGGWLLLTVGCVASGMVRPNMTATLFAAAAVGFLVRRSGATATTLTPIGKLIGVAALIIGGVLVLQHLANFLNIESLNADQIDHSVSLITKHTSQGGSSFTPHPVSITDPTTLPFAFFTVLYRPLILEVHNIGTLLAALESTFLLLLSIKSWRRFVSLRSHWRDPLVAAALVYTLLFVFGYSTFGNFGILSRERAQELPFLLVFLALPPTLPKRLIPWGER